MLDDVKMIYQPREDSFLLQKWVRKLAKGRVLDIGTGTGIQAIGAADKYNVKKVVAVDIDKKAIAYCKKNVKHKKIEFKISDLFVNVRGKFDTIIFNPPYLPADAKLGDLTLEGGKKGFETVQRFLEEAGDYLNDNGRILLLISSLTNKPKVDEIIKENLFDSRVFEIKHVFFEDLFVYKIEKKKILKDLSERGISKLGYFAKGKRGMVYTGKYKGKKIAVKIKRPSSEAVGRIENEAKWLKVLNKKNIGPKFFFSDKRYLVYEFVKGKFIVEALEGMRKLEIKKILVNVLRQCKKMDELGISKEEMHHPLKHVIITSSKKPVMIDFERVHATKKPQNMTQFCQFIISGHLFGLLEKKGFRINKKRIIQLAKNYKKKDGENFKKILVGIK